eukprot:jgi/Psemu1/7799/gm1.7799_g
MNTQFPPCIQYKRTFDVTEDHVSRKLVVDYTRATNRSAGKKTLKTYINVITPDPDAKGMMIAAFEHLHMAKPANNLTEQQRERMFIKTHPRSWQDAPYIDTAMNFKEVTISEIQDYMTRRKDNADKMKKEKDKRNKQGEPGFGQGFGRGNCRGGNGGGRYRERCKRHPNGNHTWEQCYSNPKNQQHTPYPQYINVNNSNNSYLGYSNASGQFGGQFGGRGG